MLILVLILRRILNEVMNTEVIMIENNIILNFSTLYIDLIYKSKHPSIQFVPVSLLSILYSYVHNFMSFLIRQSNPPCIHPIVYLPKQKS